MDETIKPITAWQAPSYHPGPPPPGTSYSFVSIVDRGCRDWLAVNNALDEVLLAGARGVDGGSGGLRLLAAAAHGEIGTAEHGAKDTHGELFPSALAAFAGWVSEQRGFRVGGGTNVLGADLAAEDSVHLDHFGGVLSDSEPR